MTLDDETREALGVGEPWERMALAKIRLTFAERQPMSRDERRVRQREWQRAYDAKNVERRRQRQREQKRRKRAEAKHGRADCDR